MVHKEVCTRCKGNRFVNTDGAAPAKRVWIKCPECSGQGYKIRVVK